MTVRTRGSAVDSLDLLMRCPSQDIGSAWWWASLTHQLAELGEELASTDVAGLAAQITTDAPHFAAAAHRLPAIDAQAQCDVARLRQEVNAHDGATTAAGDLRDAVDALLRRVRTLHRLCSDLMLDAYERDIGGD